MILAALGLATAFCELVNTLVNKFSDKQLPTLKRVAKKAINPTIAQLATWEERQQKKLRREA